MSILESRVRRIDTGQGQRLRQGSTRFDGFDGFEKIRRVRQARRASRYRREVAGVSARERPPALQDTSSFHKRGSHMVAVFGLVHAGRFVRRHRHWLQRTALGLITGLITTSLAACGRSAPAAGAGAGVPAMPVEIVTLESKPVEQTGDFVGTIKSRKSTTIQPQAEGIITDIAVRSGTRVTPGMTILKIDPGPQRAP